MVILLTFFSFLLIYGDLGLKLGFLGWGFQLMGWSVSFSIHSGVSHLKTYQQQVAAWLHAIMPNLMLFLESRSYFYLMQDAEIA